MLILILVVLGLGFFIVSDSRQKMENNTTVINPGNSIIGTYLARLQNDVYILTIDSEDGVLVKGKLDIKNFEKDSSSGAISGTYKDGILLADYTFKSEGVESVGWVAFKKIDDGFIRGYGDTGTETRAQYIDLSKIQFDTSVVYKPAKDTIISSVTFNCADQKSIKAIFYKNIVDITLSDGRSMTLPQVISASGARYANVFETFVFWNKGDTAFVNEEDKTTFKDCSVSPY